MSRHDFPKQQLTKDQRLEIAIDLVTDLLMKTRDDKKQAAIRTVLDLIDKPVIVDARKWL